MYILIDNRTGQRVGRSYATRKAASRRADVLDMQYGAIRFTPVLESQNVHPASWRIANAVMSVPAPLATEEGR